MDSGRLEALPAGTVHLDTVRALHQTVVSLRTALEVSKNELKELKEKYKQCALSNEFTDVIEKLTLENHILRRRIIDSDEGRTAGQNIQLQVTYSPRTGNFSEQTDLTGEVVIKTATPDINSELLEVKELDSTQSEEEEFCGTDNLNECCDEHQDEFFDVRVNESFGEKFNESFSEKITHEGDDKIDPQVDIGSGLTSASKNTQEDETLNQNRVSQHESKISHEGGFKTKLELLSKFDVRIKVRTLKEGTVFSSTTSETDSTSDEKRESKDPEKKFESGVDINYDKEREHFHNTQDSKGNRINLRAVSSENVKMAVPSEGDAKGKNDKFDVQVRITSEENLVVKESFDGNRRKKDMLNLDVDDLSLRSMSEGDNSVFSEGGTSPQDPNDPAAVPQHPHYDQDNVSENDSEEVDDIELIFTTDETKDMSNLREDLVSIRDTDNWCPSPPSTATHSTPVLIKFHTLDPDFQPGSESKENTHSGLQETLAETSVRAKRVSLPNDKEIRHVGFSAKSLDLPNRGILKSYDNKSDNMLHRKSPNTSTRRLDSVDSLTCDYNRALSFDNTKSSSFELGSSMDILQREESLDSFHKGNHLGHRFSVFVGTDISKCGISEDDLAGNLNVRRNTCPNPFQYRPPPYRGFSRPYKQSVSPGLVGSCTRVTSRGGRRENAAQTDMSALPPSSSSDGYLAHKIGRSSVSAMAPLPQRTPAPCYEHAPPARPAPRPSPPIRRQLLSDLGFTSMVPELSRSADPLWAASSRRPPAPCVACGHDASEPSAKMASRSASYRSPSASYDRSDWPPQSVYVPPPPARGSGRLWRSSMPDVRGDDTDQLLYETEVYLRRSSENLRDFRLDPESDTAPLSRPYIPAEPRHLRLGHAVKVITPQGRIAVGRVRYVGLAGSSAKDAAVMVGGIFCPRACPGLPPNDGTHLGRRYFHAPPPHHALFVPFSKVVMAWAD